MCASTRAGTLVTLRTSAGSRELQLLALRPYIILAQSHHDRHRSSLTETRIIPIVFVHGLPIPLGLGFVSSLARPGG